MQVSVRWLVACSICLSVFKVTVCAVCAVVTIVMVMIIRDVWPNGIILMITRMCVTNLDSPII